MEKVDDPMGSLICGAKTRAGGTCRQPPMANGRCRFHGGMSLSGKAHGRYTRGKYTKDALANRRELSAMHMGLRMGWLKPRDLFGPGDNIENNIPRCGCIRDHLKIAKILLLGRQTLDLMS